jgi:HEAT repeat protein
MMRPAARAALAAVALTLTTVVAGPRAEEPSVGSRGVDALSAAARDLKDSRVNVRVEAASALGSMVSEGEAVVPLLAAAVQDPSDHVRRTAILGLARLAPYYQAAIVPLVRALGDADPLVQDNAVWGLQSSGGRAVPALTDALRLREEGIRVRVAALEILQSISRSESGLLPPPTIDVLTATLDDPSPDVRAASARGLGAAGQAAQTAIARLRQVSSGDIVDYVRAAAADAVTQIVRVP